MYRLKGSCADVTACFLQRRKYTDRAFFSVVVLLTFRQKISRFVVIRIFEGVSEGLEERTETLITRMYFSLKMLAIWSRNSLLFGGIFELKIPHCEDRDGRGRGFLSHLKPTQPTMWGVFK
ncbi:hypothetical protein CRENBAI_015531 [Crenichthys baileyi]|uniref:Uncharacterized protein n=1 Tax=Crenichthys baileyi TaxID=28760 RepID=A0AAV9SD64_9TELE